MILRRVPLLVFSLLLLGVLMLSAPGSVSTSATGPTPRYLNSNATSDTAGDEHIQIASDGGSNVVAVWEEDLSQEANMLSARSSDGGDTWSAPSHVNPWAGSLKLDTKPAIATDSSGTWIAVWSTTYSIAGGGANSSIVFSRSFDNGATWSAPAVLDTASTNDTPSVAYGNGAWVTIFSHGATQNVTDVRRTRSTDGGATWSAPTVISTAQTGNFEPALATDGAGNWMAFWEVENLIALHDKLLYVSKSTDNGVTMSAPLLVNPIPINGSSEDITPNISTDGVGTWLLAWSHLDYTMGSFYAAQTAVSTDFGTNWTNVQTLGNAGTLPGTVHTTGQWMASWLGINGYRVAYSPDGTSWQGSSAISDRTRLIGSLDRTGIDIAASGVTVVTSFEVGGTQAPNEDGDVMYTLCSTANDSDCDTIANATDNCPTDANYTQADTDLDGLGDNCDATPTGDVPAGVDDLETLSASYSPGTIPGDFFGPGSDPFNGNISMIGTPIDLPTTGSADTIVQRLEPANVPAVGNTDNVAIQLLALNLSGVSPVTVTYNGGQNPEQWLVRLSLTPSSSNTGSMDITRADSQKNFNTGVVSLSVSGRYTFRRVSDSAVATFDATPVSVQSGATVRGSATCLAKYVDSPTVCLAVDWQTSNRVSLGLSGGAMQMVTAACTDHDGDGRSACIDNCPEWANPNQGLPNWTIPGNDLDCDGFADIPPAFPPASEAQIGTDATKHCAATAGANNESGPDAWPVDMNDDQVAGGQDILALAPAFNSHSPNAPYSVRFDLNGDGVIGGQDILKFGPFFNKHCS